MQTTLPNPQDPLIYLSVQGDNLYQPGHGPGGSGAAVNLIPLSQARVPVLDRGFVFGDGVYEVLPVYNRRLFRAAQHMTRLARSLAAIRLSNPYTAEQWLALAQQVIDANSADDQFVYIQITRGVAKRDHAFPQHAIPTVFINTSPLVLPSAEQREHGVATISIADERWLHCEIKSISLLGNVLARQQAVDAGVMEVLQFRGDYLTEGAASNIWVVRDGAVLAPPKNNLVLEGIRYGLIEELATTCNIPLTLRPITRAEVLGADELLLSSATKEILPITQLDGRPVGSGPQAGKPGPIYAALYAAYQAAKAQA